MEPSPRKYLLKDLINKPMPTEVWVQGKIEQTVGNDILIISDNTGKAKITKCESADGIVDRSSVCKGTYCCIIGTAVKSKGLPEIQATKFIDLNKQPQMRLAWDNEVKEVNLYMEGKVQPMM